MARRVIVYHGMYGCDTGCCGHIVEIKDGEDTIKSDFNFSHPYDRDPREYAKKLVKESFGEDHVADFDWENCQIENC